jgi:hypothetical protein
VAGAVLAFVAGVVLFVHHDQLQAGHRCEHRHARAQHDARAALVRSQPAVQALHGRHAAVHGHHGLRAIQGRKALYKACLQLRREVDLGHHHQHLGLRCAGQHAGGALQIDLGFAAAGGTEK